MRPLEIAQLTVLTPFRQVAVVSQLSMLHKMYSLIHVTQVKIAALLQEKLMLHIAV